MSRFARPFGWRKANPSIERSFASLRRLGRRLLKNVTFRFELEVLVTQSLEFRIGCAFSPAR